MPFLDRLWDSAADRIYERQNQAFRCITSDLGETHRFRTGWHEGPIPRTNLTSMTGLFGCNTSLAL